jgi:hypothetical protein
VEWVKPIGEVEREFRRRGAFMLVDARCRKLWFFHYSKSAVTVNQMMDSLKGRSDEMVNFLIARASAKGETE